MSRGAGSFGALERRRQAAFRRGLTTPFDAIGRRHDYLLALGCEEENLHPSLRGENGALRYFAERGIKWWQASASGDASDGKRPTRNMVQPKVEPWVGSANPLAGSPAKYNSPFEGRE